MRKIKVIGAFVMLYGGRVRLTEQQARIRSHAIVHVEKDLYEIVKPVGFKHGEEFSFDGEVGKGSIEDVEEIRAVAKQKETKEKAEA